MHAKWICGLALIAMVAFPSISEGKGEGVGESAGRLPRRHSALRFAPCATAQSGVECER